MCSRVSYLFALALALALARPVTAQQTVDVGSISGRVVDEMGMAVPGVTVVATHRLTNVVSATVSDDSGRFRLPYLRIGVYDLKASLGGFKDFTRTARGLGGLGVRDPGRAGNRDHQRNGDDRHRGAGARIGAESDRDNRVG